MIHRSQKRRVPLSAETRSRLAILSALGALVIFISLPWLLTRYPLLVSSKLTFPAGVTRSLPTLCTHLMLYVGYPGCNTECPRALSTLALALSEYERAHNKTQCALFLSMFPDQTHATTRFASTFHSKLIGVSLSAATLPPLLRALGIESSLTPEGTHRDMLYTLERRGGIKHWRIISVASVSAMLDAP